MAQILVVEDDLGMQRLLEMVLSASGHQVSLAQDAHTALEFLNVHTPDLILTDVMMPGIDGISLVSRVKSSKRLKKVPIIVLTGGSPDLQQHAEMVGANIFMQKPVGGKRLREAVEALLNKSGFVLPSGELVGQVNEVVPLLAQALPPPERFAKFWSKRETRNGLLRSLEIKGWGKPNLERLAEFATLPPDCDLYDILGHLCFGWPLLRRSQRAAKAKQALSQHPEAALLGYWLDLYAQEGIEAVPSLDNLDRPEAVSLGGSQGVQHRLGGMAQVLELWALLEKHLYEQQ